MKFSIKKIQDPNKPRASATILSVPIERPANAHEKEQIESKLIEYAKNTLFPSEGLNIYRNLYVDTISIVVVVGINAISEENQVIGDM